MHESVLSGNRYEQNQTQWSNTELTLTGLSLGSYSIFVVGSGADGDHVLPSDHSDTAAVMIGYVLWIWATYMFYIVQIFHSSHPFQPPSSTSIMVSWTPTLVSRISYRVGYSCQLIYGSSSVWQTDTVNESLPEYMHAPLSLLPLHGSTCTVNVTAVFGSTVVTNSVTNSINTNQRVYVLQWCN